MKYFFKVLAFIFCLNINAQSPNKNYILNEIFLNENASESIKEINYIDGLGYTEQIITSNLGFDGKDQVLIKEYDSLGFEKKIYLPYPKSNTNLEYQQNAYQELFSYYQVDKFDNSTNPYTELSLANRLSKRVISQYHPGRSWAKVNGKGLKKSYDLNSVNDSIVRYLASRNFNTQSKSYENNLSQEGIYVDNLLKKESLTNEDGKVTVTFKDVEDKIVLIRKFENQRNIDTYYVYDNVGNLIYVIPPNVKKNAVISSTDLVLYCYQYKYDAKNRVVEKKLPNNILTRIVYNNYDQIALLQSNNEDLDEWQFFKYDQFKRLVISGTYNTSLQRHELQNLISNNNFEKRSNTSYTNNGNVIFYTNNNFPTSDFLVHNINYYDYYDNIDNLVFSNSYDVTLITESDKGKLHNKLLVVQNNLLKTNYWQQENYYYDAINHQIAKLDQVENYKNSKIITEYLRDFRGNVLEEKITNSQFGNTPITLNNSYVYNNSNMLLSFKQNINSGASIDVINNDYSENGLLKHSYFNNNFLSSNFSYNIRGWLTNHNLIKENENSFLFNYSLFYDQPKKNTSSIFGRSISTPLFNGNVSFADVFFGTDNISKGYKYTYDDLNRLTLAEYYKGPKLKMSQDNSFREEISYDKIGNITKLSRTGESISGQTVEIDDLVYNYHHGRLDNVKDNTNNSSGFNSNNVQNQFIYDSNGNILVDNNKKITNIDYNYLNLPEKFFFQNGSYIEIKYFANGKVFEKLFYDINTNVTKTLNYLDNFEYINDDLNLFHHSYGYVSSKNGNFIYNYTVKDHLGNNRMIYNIQNDQINITETNSYYPFGLRHVDSGDLENSDNYKIKFGSKEYISELGLDLYDFGARNYDPALGRWLNVDPLAEKMPNYSSYNYTLNNPINFVDPDGRIPYPITIRSFAPFKTFGGGFHGDDRGYSTSASASARVHQRINFDTDKNSMSLLNWSSSTWHSSAPGFRRTADPSGGFTSGFGIFQEGSDKNFWFSTSYAGANPLTPGAPNIDVASKFYINENKEKGFLQVRGNLVGDNFPNTESFITDPSGQSVFLGIGFYEGSPFTSLSGKNERPISEFNVRIKTGKDGNFEGVYKNDGSDKIYSIKEWNARFENANPHKKNE